MVSIKAEKREIKGKAVRTLRKQGKIPAVLYGMGEKEILLEILERDFDKLFREAGESTLIELDIGTEKKNVLIHEVAFDPIKDKPLHVDFLQVRMDKPIRAKVPLVFEGESPAVKNLGGILVKVLHELEVEALPKDLPHEIKVDISGLENLEDKFMVGGLKLPSTVKFIAEKEEVLALIETPRAEEEIKEEEAAPSLESIEVVGKKEKKEKEEGEATAESPEAKKESSSAKPESKEKK